MQRRTSKAAAVARRTLRYVYNGMTARNLALIGIVIAISIVSIQIFGYLMWRRFVIPTEAACLSFLLWKLGSKLKTPTARIFILSVSGVLSAFSVFSIIGAFIDNIFFAETGYFVFTMQAVLVLAVIVFTAEAADSYKSREVEGILIDTFSSHTVSIQMTQREREIEAIAIKYGLK